MAQSKHTFKVRPLFIVITLVLLAIGAGLGYYVGYDVGFEKARLSKDELRGINVALAPRGKIIEYTVTKNDTLELIAQYFSISPDTIRWENNLSRDKLLEGQVIRILPVTGVSHVVDNGDTIDYLAIKYNTNKQKIIDYPFNQYSDPTKFTLIPGTILIIPDGKK